MQVGLKKQYNTQYKNSRNLLSGDQWYCYQAFRALNQAVGRCIRHQHDYGAIIFIDERFRKQCNLEYVSKWLRKSIWQMDSIECTVEGLHRFFKRSESRTADDSIRVLDCNDNPPRLPTVPVETDFEIGGQEKQAHMILEFASDNKISFNTQERPPLREITGTINYSMQNDSHHRGFPLSHGIKKLDSESTSDDCNAYLNKKEYQVQMSTSEDILLRQSEQLSSKPISCISTVLFPNAPNDLMPSISSRSERDHLSETNSSFRLGGPFSNCMESGMEYSLAMTTGNASSVGVSTKTHPLRFQLSPALVTQLFPSETDGSEPEICLLESCQNKQMQLPPSDLFGNQSFGDSSIDDVPGQDLALLSTLQDFDSTIRTLSPDVACAEQRGELKQKLCISDKVTFHQSISDVFQDPSFNVKMESTNNVICTKRLAVLCGRCGCSLSASEEEMNVTYYETTLAKSYLQSLLDSNNVLAKRQPADCTRLLILESSCLGSSILNGEVDLFGSHVVNPIQGLWVEEDGCVFKPLFCPWCKDCSLCVGAHVLAADRMNIPLVGKVLLFTDIVNIETGELQMSKNCLGDLRCTMEEGRKGCRSSPAKRDRETPIRAKLKLRRGE
eukprot:c19029_g2_i2 orf=1126-2967(+)